MSSNLVAVLNYYGEPHVLSFVPRCQDLGVSSHFCWFFPLICFLSPRPRGSCTSKQVLVRLP